MIGVFRVRFSFDEPKHGRGEFVGKMLAHDADQATAVATRLIGRAYPQAANLRLRLCQNLTTYGMQSRMGPK